MFTILFNLAQLSIEVTAKTQYIWTAAGPESRFFLGERGDFQDNILKNVLSYCYNNGVIAWINEDGREFIAPTFRGLIEYLENEGCTYSSFSVPFSNGERFLDEDVQERWSRLRAICSLYSVIKEEDFLKACRKAAGLEP